MSWWIQNEALCLNQKTESFYKETPHKKRLTLGKGNLNRWGTRQRAIFTRANLAIVTTEMLNFCVRDGYRCDHLALVTGSSSFSQNQITVWLSSVFLSRCFVSVLLWLNPRSISISQLHASLHFHLWPIYLVVFKGSYYIMCMGNLILESVSRLDAFSVYPFHS